MKNTFWIITLVFVSCVQKDTRSVFKKGTDAFFFKDYSTAIDCMNRTLKLKPNFYEAYFVRGNSYEKIGDFKKAIADYTSVIKYNPKSRRAYRRRATIYFSLGDTVNGYKDWMTELFLD